MYHLGIIRERVQHIYRTINEVDDILYAEARSKPDDDKLQTLAQFSDTVRQSIRKLCHELDKLYPKTQEPYTF